MTHYFKTHIVNKIAFRLIALFVMLCVYNNAFSQVTVAGSTGANGTYARLGLAFTAINGTAQTGNNIIVTITASTTETASAILNAGAWASLRINPTVAALTISGNLAAPLIDLNGADNVTIDGRVNAAGATKSLVISNTNTSSGTTSTIRFINSASSNTVRYCTISGSETDAASGLIFLSTSSAGSGNDNITIDNNNITSATNRPINAIYSSGTSGSVNDNLTVSNNNIYNVFNLTNASQCISLNNFTSTATISTNSFYESTAFNPTLGYSYIIISVDNPDGNGFNISGNYIGGNAALCAGTWSKSNAANNTFNAIRLNVGNSVVSSIQNNTIKGFNWTNSSSANWQVFNIVEGNVNIGTTTGNTIGATTGTGLISVTAAGNNMNLTCLQISSTGTVNFQNNIIGAITTNNSNAANDANILLINKENVAGNTTISNNTIGSTSTANSINASCASSASSQNVRVILLAGTGNNVISNNTIANVTNGTTSNLSNYDRAIIASDGINTITNNTVRDFKTSSKTSSLYGIVVWNNPTVNTITGNTVYNLSSLSLTDTGSVFGISVANTTLVTPNTISRNFIYGLSTASAGVSIYGLNINGGVNTISNNIITITNNISPVYGISENGTSLNDNNNLYNNTVYIGGTVTAGAINSYAFYSFNNLNIRDIRNNIFSNFRTNTTGTGIHYSAYFNYTSVGSLTLDYNNYFVSGTGGTLGFFNLASVTSLPLITGFDAQSKKANPSFTSAGGTVAANYLPISQKLSATSISGITADYAGTVRAATPTIGAYEGTSNQVEIVKDGISQASYSTLKGAFDAINSKVFTGALEIKINGSTTETATATLYQSGYIGSGGATSYSSINIYPTISGLSISGNLPAPLIDLNGADNVTIDGRVNGIGSIKDLIITNTSNLNTVGTSTIRFINDASSNTVKYSTVKGSSLDPAAGIIFFSSGTATGNDNNTIDNNNITSSLDINRPLSAVYSLGISTYKNDFITLSNNNIYNFLNRATTSAGVNFSTNTASCRITGNSFYETSTFIPSASVFYYIISVLDSGSGGHIISNNFLGGSATACGGVWTKSSATDNFFIGIYLNCSSSLNTVNGNIIKSFNWANNNAVNTSWYGMNIQLGTFRVGELGAGNTIGSATGNGSITVSSGSSNFSVFGIYTNGAVADIKYNTIGSVTTNSTDPTFGTSHFYGIVKASATGDISYNLIGSTSTANSINASSPCASNHQAVIGIQITGSSGLNINNNTIANLQNGSTSTSINNRAYVHGIRAYNANVNNNTIYNLTIATANNSNSSASPIIGISNTGSLAANIQNNTIYNLTNSYASSAGSIFGIYFTSTYAGTNTVTGNFIHSLSFTGATSTTASVYGICSVTGLCTYSNNIIYLGGAYKSTLYGLYDTGAASQTCNIYHNSIYINGTLASGSTNKSYCLYSLAAANTRYYRNNIFHNNRTTTAGVSMHYAISLTANTTLTCDYNDYWVSGTGGVLGSMGLVDKGTIALWRTATGQDTNSLNLTPLFVVPGSTTASNYTPQTINLKGIAIDGISTDYSGTARSAVPTMGAFEGPFNYVQVYKANVLQAGYVCLKKAFDKINDGTHTGVLEIRINNSIVENSSAVLNASGTGLANYTSINIFPTTTGLSITGNLATPLIDLNGADNVTIDGRVNATGSTKDLVITNTSTSNTAGTSTIRFINDASSNTVKFCTVKGSETNATSGVIFFSTTTGTTGNDNNTIDNNNITSDIDTNRPVNAVYSEGSATYLNDNITISNNSIYNFLNRSLSSNGIFLSSNTTTSSILNNSLYETSTFIPTTGVSFILLKVSNTSAENMTISGNYLGGNAALATGTFTKSSATNNIFTAIYISTGTTVTSNVDNNIIRNFSWTNSANATWKGIDIYGGLINIGSTSGNTIGASTGNGSITVTNASSDGAVYGIYLTPSTTVNIQNNVIGSIIAANSNSANSTYLYGIMAWGGLSGTFGNNLIGSNSTTNSLQASSASTGSKQNVFGMYLYYGGGTFIVENNIIANITNSTTNSNTATYGKINGIYAQGYYNMRNNTIHDLTNSNANATLGMEASVSGIVLNGHADVRTVDGNTIYNLINSYPGFTGAVVGIYAYPYNRFFTIDIKNNFIYDLKITGAGSTAGSIIGIKSENGNAKYVNNIISISDNSTSTIYGIYDEGALIMAGYYPITSFYFNTISIGGNLSTGATNKSYGIYSGAGTTIADYRNNLVINDRSTDAGTNLHYAAYFNYNTNTNLTSDYNDFYASGTGGVVGFYNSTNYNTITTFSTATGKDINSYSVDPQFVDPTGTDPSDYNPITKNLGGTTISGVTSDYDASTRGTIPFIGAYEGILDKVQVYKSNILEASYYTLKSAFDAINAGTHTGDLEIKITESTTETASAVLNASGSGIASYTSINIYPTVSGLSVTGNLATPLINLNGADNVTIDGRVNSTGSSKDLILNNTNTSITSTISLQNDASNNTVKYCIIKGSTTNTTGGIIYITEGTSTGNDNNLFDFNDITCATDLNRPLNAIYSRSTNGGIVNNNITVSNNNIYNIYNRTNTWGSIGINMNAGTADCTITNNSIYETATHIPTANVTFYGIMINSFVGSNFTVTNNYIGGSAPLCQGSPFTKTSAANSDFYGLYLYQSTSGAASSIQNNTIANIAWNNSSNATFRGIQVNAGNFNIGTISGNTIGNSTGNSSIVVTNATTGGVFYGIHVSSVNTVNIQNNTISGIDVTNSNSANATNFYGIYKSSGAGNTTITNNLVGSTTISNSINAQSASTANAQMVYGIYNAGTGVGSTFNTTNNNVANITNGTTNSNTATTGLIHGIYSSTSTGTINITGNTIRNLSIANANTNNALYTSAVGLFVYTTSAGATVSTNSIHNISNTFDTFSGHVAGMVFIGNSTSSTVAQNFIHSISASGTNSTTASLYGIKILSGVASFSNNIITLSPVSLSDVYGIANLASTSYASINFLQIYFNTVYIGGSILSGTNKSYALYDATDRTRYYKNNIFSNARSTTGGTNLHYAFYHALNTNNPSQCEYNNYSVTGVGGTLGFYNSANVTNTPIITGMDAGSINYSPAFVNAGGTSTTDYIPAYTRLIGNAGTAITTDYALTSRNSIPTIGAFEIDLNLNVEVWKTGVLQTDYLTLKDAFAAINAGTHTGDLEIRVTESTTETASAVLYHSGYNGTSSYTSINIYPTTTGLSITGNLATPLIDLDGADNVTIDGRVNATGSTKDLIITNTNTSVGTTSTIRFINDASSNTVKYCTLKGSETGTTSAVVMFSTSTGTTGNDNNLIDNNNITSSTDVNRPVNAIYSLGSSTLINNGNSITNNNIYDFFNRGIASYGVKLESYTSESTISGNNFYETTSFTPSASVAYNVIYLSNVAGNSNVINNNNIGGSTTNCGGTAWTKPLGQNNIFTAIYLSVGTSVTSEVNGNTISNFNYSNSGGGDWVGIYHAAGNVSVGTTSANTIGASTGNGSISYSSNTTGGFAIGVFVNGTGNIVCQNNVIGSIAASNSSTNLATGLAGIYVQSSSGTRTFNNNTIGSLTTSNSLNATSVSSTEAQPVYGIYSTGTGTTITNGNTIANLTNGTTNTNVNTAGVLHGIYVSSASNVTINNNTIHDLTISNASTAINAAAPLTGIMVTSNTTNTISGNSIYNISNNYASYAGAVYGVYVHIGINTSNIYKNFIHDLNVANTSTGTVYGIKKAVGNTNINNNIVSIKNVPLATVYGINDDGGAGYTSNIYFNTVSLEGTSTSGSNNSYALLSGLNGIGVNVKNNILSNLRTNSGGTGKHYAVSYVNPTGSARDMDYNNLYTPGTGGYAASFNGTDYATFSNLQANIGYEQHSKSRNPLFASIGGTLYSDYLPAAYLPAVSGTGITTDYTATTRTGAQSMGALIYSTTVSITTHPESQTICEGEPVTFTVVADNADSYQWKKAGVDISGETSASLTINPVATTDAGSYTCDVTNIFGTVTSNAAILTVSTVPAQPSVISGSTTVYKSSTGNAYSVTNVAGVTYAWSYSGTGATINGSGNSITVDFAINATSGTLSVTPSNSCGDGTARTVGLTVLPYPVEVWKSSTFQQGFTTLKGAFDAVNAGTHTGALEIRINTNTTETASAVLNASGTGSANYSAINIFPTVTGLTVSGNLAFPLIDLNGADNVTIDGRVNATGSTKDLTISNTSTSATIGTSTIRFLNDASNNTLNYCTLKGSNAMTGGVVYVSTTSATTGNDYNTIDNNNITNANNSNRPHTLVCIDGTSSKDNDNVIVSNNYLYDFVSGLLGGSAVLIGNGANTCSITGNSIYETSTIVPTANAGILPILINSTGNNFTISNNYIGGNAPLCSGIWTKSNEYGTPFYGIYVNAGSTGNSVTNNTIKNFNWSDTNNGTLGWTGIYFNAGAGNVNNNSIGEATGNGSISIISETTLYGINLLSGATCSDNTIGSITTNSTSTTKACSITGIWAQSTNTLSNNLIGSLTTANSINAISASTNITQDVYGIVCQNAKSTLTNNMVANLTNGSTGAYGRIHGVKMLYGSDMDNNTIRDLSIANNNTALDYTSSAMGVFVRPAMGTVNILNSKIYNIVNTNSSFSGLVSGIYYQSSETGLIDKNFIHDINVNSSSTSASVCGIKTFDGTLPTTYSNNIITLGGEGQKTIYGIYNTTGVVAQDSYYYFNTIYIYGTPTTGSLNSYAFYSNTNTSVRNIRNNIFTNVRSNNGATGKHYAAYFNYGSASLLTLNYNNYYTPGTGGTIAYYNNADITTLAGLRTAIGHDTNSLNVNPQFISGGSSVATDYKMSYSKLIGVTGTGITTDFGASTRLNAPNMGAWEFAGINMWKGNVSTNWGTANNWTLCTIPATDANINFDPMPLNHCLLDQNRSVTDINNIQSTYRAVTNGFNLTVKGNFNFTNGAQMDASASASTLTFAGSSAQSILPGSLFNNKVYNVSINNSNNVTLYGTLNLMNTITATSGLLDATTQTPTVIFGGTTSQTIDGSRFTNDRIYNLISDNAAGVTVNTTFTVGNDLTINSGKLLNIGEDKQLNVLGTIANNAGTAGFVIKSSATGTGSLIHNTDNVPATAKRYIDGTATAWHFLSSPISNQAISGEWKPTGTYGDGTGYDLYVWDEPASCWIYNLNTTVSPTWSSVHASNNFVPGRGYLYAVQATTPTKNFTGNLNNGNISIPVTRNASTAYVGINQIGNPYPSSIDWKENSGFSRTMLTQNGGGYDMWTWSNSANNYGVYNSAEVDDMGTNNVSRYIAPMQGIFVYAASNGNFEFNNAARVHDGASVWNKAKRKTDLSNRIALIASSEDKLGSDEIRIYFGNKNNLQGARKMYSNVKTAPSLYVPFGNYDYSTRYLTDTLENRTIPVSFKAGKLGMYEINAYFDYNTFGTLILEDKQLNRFHDLKANSNYRFETVTGDTNNRFVLHFTPVSLNSDNWKALVYVENKHARIQLEDCNNSFHIRLFDTSGRAMDNATAKGGETIRMPLGVRGAYLIKLTSNNITKTYKIIY